MENQMIGRGRDAITMIADPDSFVENVIGSHEFNPEIGAGAVVGTITLSGSIATVISNDAQAVNERFPVVYFGVIGMDEAYKMACAVYETILADAEKPVAEKRPIILIVDTPGNGPGKVEEIFGMNKATGAYQLALAEARKSGHAVIAMVIGRAISGAFLCHGLQADHILALPKEYGTVIHVMPLSSISRITKMDIEQLEELSAQSPVFASGVNFFYKLGGIEEIVATPEDMKKAVTEHAKAVAELKAQGKLDQSGPWHRGVLGAQRMGRTTRPMVLEKMEQEFATVEQNYLR